MIKSLTALPDVFGTNPESVKFLGNYDVYKNSAKFYTDLKGSFALCILDLNAVICGKPENFEELNAFLKMSDVKSVFLNSDNLKELEFKNAKIVSVYEKSAVLSANFESGEFKSDEVYNMLLKGGFSLPEFEYFAVDFCRRINLKNTFVFGEKNEFLSLGLKHENVCLVNGVVSFKKGGGRKALMGLEAVSGCEKILACCTEENEGFYEKCGFIKTGSAVYCYL